MRTIHDDLITAQQSGTATPYIYLSINSTDYSGRLISLEHREEPYRDTATIVLNNADRYFDSNDLRGKSLTIGYGYATTSGNRYCGDGAGSEATPTLWVKSQSMVSMRGVLVCVLYCEGGWMKLREYDFITTSDPPHFSIPFTATQTVWGIVEIALDEAGFTLNAIGDQDDGIGSVYNPIFTANPLVYESPASIIHRLVLMTESYLREVEGSAFEIVYPQDSDSADETYYSDQAPYFEEYVEKLSLLVPNSIVVFCNRDPNGEWDTEEYPLITGTASNAESIADYGEVIKYFIAPFIEGQTDANNRADAILTRLKNEILAGRLLLPFHDCRVELYDKVAIEDRRV